MKKKIFLGAIGGALLSMIITLVGLCWLAGLDSKSALDIGRFFCVMKFIEKNYVEEVDKNKLIDGAIGGMVHALGDPHSLYLNPNLYSQLKVDTTGSFGGIGVYMGFTPNGVKILGVMPNSPGEKVGLLANDEIRAVDGKPISEINPGEVAIKIRGKVGEPVELLIHREGVEEDKTYTLTREVINFKTVFGQMIDDKLAYMRISNFSENTGKEFREILRELEGQGMKGMILDLRENPGGVITSCIEIANEIVPAGTVTSVIDRDGETKVYKSELPAARFPIVVLLDENSASASELLSGALQDTKAALIVGDKSYGKGSVQTLIPMLQDDGLKLTVAKYYTPNGRSIDGVGIEPDVKVKLESPPKFSYMPEAELVEDAQVKMAKELLANQIAAGKILFDDVGKATP